MLSSSKRNINDVSNQSTAECVTLSYTFNYGHLPCVDPSKLNMPTQLAHSMHLSLTRRISLRVVEVIQQLLHVGYEDNLLFSKKQVLLT